MHTRVPDRAWPVSGYRKKTNGHAGESSLEGNYAHIFLLSIKRSKYIANFRYEKKTTRINAALRISSTVC